MKQYRVKELLAIIYRYRGMHKMHNKNAGFSSSAI